MTPTSPPDDLVGRGQVLADRLEGGGTEGVPAVIAARSPMPDAAESAKPIADGSPEAASRRPEDGEATPVESITDARHGRTELVRCRRTRRPAT